MFISSRLICKLNIIYTVMQKYTIQTYQVCLMKQVCRLACSYLTYTIYPKVSLKLSTESWHGCHSKNKFGVTKCRSTINFVRVLKIEIKLKSNLHLFESWKKTCIFLPHVMPRDNFQSTPWTASVEERQFFVLALKVNHIFVVMLYIANSLTNKLQKIELKIINYYYYCYKLQSKSYLLLLICSKVQAWCHSLLQS